MNNDAPVSDSTLSSTFEAITSDSPQIRILLLGKTGCGKSSLINKVFGVERDFAKVSHDHPGETDINREFRHPSNDRFIFHDSEGFKPGRDAEFNIVKRFIEERDRSEVPPKDRLHVIWICISVPMANDRVIETGVMDIFRMVQGRIPVIVVFTKYDRFATTAVMEARDAIASLSDEEVWRYIKAKAREAAETLCISPWRKEVGKEPLMVSIHEEFEETIQELIKATDEEVKQHRSRTDLNFSATQRSNAGIEMDGLYLETLNRVPDRVFLKTFLGLLVGRSSVNSRYSLSKDDAMLMDDSDQYGEGLQETRSILLGLEPFDQSFLNFLQDPSRSGQYHVAMNAGTRQYLELITKLLISHAGLTNHGHDHFAPEFGKLIKHNPQAIELDVKDWEQALEPLINALKKLLVPSKIDSLIDGYCRQCRFFQITHDILTHFKSLRKREDSGVEKCLKSLKEIILDGNSGHYNFEINFCRIVFGSAAVSGTLMAILAHLAQTQ